MKCFQSLFVLAGSCLLLFSGCPGTDPAYTDPIREHALSVIPEPVANAEYSTASTDAFFDSTYVIRDTTNFTLRVYNAASADQARLDLNGASPTIASGVNDISDTQLIISVNDPTKLRALDINGVAIPAGAFMYGAPILIDGEEFLSGRRLPGHFTVVSVGALAAGKFANLDVRVTGRYGLQVHFDAFGEVWGGRVLVTGAAAGTTYVVTTPEPPVLHQLTVSKSGTGTGSISSMPAGVDCGSHCSANFVAGTAVTLTASPSAGSSFVGWSGACTGSGMTCTLTMSAARNVTAQFKLQSFNLAVARTGTGSGTIVSLPAGIDCGASCSATFDYGTLVTLTAIPSSTSEFAEWTGACAGSSATCTVTIGAAKTATARFELKSYELAVSTTGLGVGKVTSLPAGIDCATGATGCSAFYPHGTTVTLVATAEPGASFGGWTGACATEPTRICSVTLDEAKSVGARFDVARTTLTVTSSGLGTGTITSSPSGIDCGSICTSEFEYGTFVTLTATPNTGAIFTRWSGACTGGDPTCTILIGSTATVTATFEIAPYPLAVSTTGTGTGTIVSTPAGIDCGSSRA